MNILYLSLIAIIPPLQATPWVNNYEEAYALYQHYNAEKPLFIIFSAEWCGPCQSLKKELDKFENSKLFDKYICVRADIEDKRNRVIINYARKNVPEWSRGPRVPMMMVIGGGRSGTKLGFTKAADIAVWLRSLEPEIQKATAETSNTPTYRFVPTRRPVYSSGCVSCY